MDLSQFRKIKSDKASTTLKHINDQHEIKLNHGALKPEMKSQLEKLPVHKFADGGDVEPNATPLPSDEDAIQAAQSDQPIPDNEPSTGQKLEDIFVPKGLQPTADSASGFFSKRIADLNNPDFVNAAETGKPLQPTAQGLQQQSPTSIDGALTPQQGQQQEQPTQNQLDPFGLNQSFQGQIGALNEQKQGQQIMAGAQGREGAAQAEAQKQYQTEVRQNLAKTQLADNELTKERMGLQNDIANGHVNPKQYLENMSTGKHIATGLGLILGGMGAGLTHGPNLAFQYLQNQIDRDIDSQKTELGKKENLLSHNLQETNNLRAAADMTRLQTNDIMSSHLKQLAGTAQSDAARGMLLNVAGMYDNQTAQLQHNLAIQKMQLGGAGNGQDPARLVPLLVPKEHQAKAFSEIEAAEDTRKMSGSILQSFEDAAKKNTTLRTGAGLLRTPAEVYALHQSMQPTFKDLEGTVRQAAMDNTFKNITPMPGDADSTINTKRQALKDYLQSKLSAPTARGYGIDLAKFHSTAPAQGYSPQQNSMEGKTASGPSGKIIMRNGRWVPLNG